MNSKFLVVVVGPTAVGKTAVAVKLAKWLNTEVISADSRQFYKEMAIGTAKPTHEEMGGVIHHFVDDRSIHDPLSAGQFAREADVVLQEIFNNHEVAVLTGGSGLYVDALIEGLADMPVVDQQIQEALRRKLSAGDLPELLKELAASDPGYFKEVDKNNGQRVVRALEVIRQSGKPYSSFRKAAKKNLPYNVIKVGLQRSREELYERINKRMDLMIEAGLFKEAEKLIAHRNYQALNTVGYKEVFGYLDGKYDYAEAVRLLKRNTRRYAKRQLTWFNRDDSIRWFDVSNIEAIKSYLQEIVSKP